MSRTIIIRITAAVALLFGIATIKEGGAVLFFDGEARLAAGNYVPFVLWSNFFAGFFYILSGVGLWFLRSWGARLALIIFMLTVSLFVMFGIYVWSGGLFENRTIVAMTIRTAVWAIIGLAGYYLVPLKQTTPGK
ncbi:hypothetical protein JNM05_05110 [bacterium]|nr:hypothetical protein [bacterium]MBL7994730.1 hypothetical protein [bacterium]